ncbi:PhoH family protein [Azonexus sp.]|uniref:PhoH family protein n=1 Tax=Azonexus sp. TaxID=1872668 RepID=UPI0039E3FBB6
MNEKPSPLPHTEISLTPLDNNQLAQLCGPLDENIRQIETGFDVSIRRRNERFTISGLNALRTADALRHFYALARQPLSIDDIQLGLIELLNAPVQRIDPASDSPNLSLNLSPSTGPRLITRKNEVHGRTPRQVEYLKHIQAHDITFGIGPAGTGKTYLAVASAVDAFERELVERIILTRPAVEAGERLGFLPGDLTQKIDPYLRPLYDALYDLMGAERVAKLYEKRAIEIAPLAFMRGRTLNHAFVILDEAQNTTPEQMKMFLTRIGIGARAVVTGDITQIDLPKGQKSGLKEALDVLHDVRGIAFTHFRKEDVVRHPLVARIVEAYENHQHTS